MPLVYKFQGKKIWLSQFMGADNKTKRISPLD